MPRIPKCLKPIIWKITLKEIEKLDNQPIDNPRLQELRKFSEALTR
jgi:hypothetical protein